MKKILFLINTLNTGGAERVLVDLVSKLPKEDYRITVQTLVGGRYEAELPDHVQVKKIIRTKNPRLTRLFTKLLSKLPALTGRLFVKNDYDIEVAYLEGPASRIISGCSDGDTKTITWIHCTMKSEKEFSVGFRSPQEAKSCYSRFDRGIFVSRGVMDAFCGICPLDYAQVVYNTNESDVILKKAAEAAELPGTGLRWCGMGKLVELKGFDRMLRIQYYLAMDAEGRHP